MKSDINNYLFDYWNKLRGDDIAPQRKSLDPVLLKDILPNLFLLDRNSNTNFNFRLAGTKMCKIFDGELRDQNFLDLWSKNDRDSFTSLFDSLCEQGAVVVCGLKGVAINGKNVPLEMLALPLFHGKSNICSSVIGSFSYDRELDQKFMLPISKIEISSLRVIWPVEQAVEIASSPKLRNLSLKVDVVAENERDYLKRRSNFKVIDGGKN